MSDTYDIVQQAMDRLSAGDTVDTVGLAVGNEPPATLLPLRLEPGDMIAGITNHGNEPLLLYPPERGPDLTVVQQQPAAFAMTEPTVTPEMVNAGNAAAILSGEMPPSYLDYIYRAMRALEPMPVTPGLWSDDSYRALLAENERMREVMHVTALLSKPGAGMVCQPMELPRASEPLGPHLTALRGLP